MKKTYQKPTADWLSFRVEEILTLSNGGQGAGNSDGYSDLFSTESYQVLE